jgi:butyrate kinase
MQKKENPIMLILMYGGTTTKAALYKGDEQIVKETLRHSLEEMNKFETFWDQSEMRRKDIVDWVTKHNYKLEDLDAIVTASGLVKACEPGVYLINEDMVADMRSEKYGIHTSNPGCVLCYELGQQYKIPAIVVDPTTDVNMMAIARYSGLPGVERHNSYHVANQKSVANLVAERIGKKYEDANIIVAHIGSGTTVGAHCHGKVIDVNNGIEADGPFSAVRCGAVPVGQLVDLCYSGDYTKQQMHKLLGAQSGLAGYLGTSDGEEIEKRIVAGDKKAQEVVEAMAYQVAKEIGQRVITLRGDVDAVAITGGLANWKRVTDSITYWTQHIAPVYVYPGENELEALASGAIRYLRGEEEAKVY